MTAHKRPKFALVAIALGIVCASQPISLAAQKTKKNHPSSSSAPAASQSDVDDVAAVRTQIDVLTQSLADGDASKLASLWKENGSYINEDGLEVRGKPALQERFASVFDQEGKQLVKFEGPVRILAANVALAEGVVKRSGAEGPTPETRYSMVWVKQNGAWLISTATETPFVAESNGNPLGDLSWLIGEWSAERDGGTVHMKAEWAPNQRFITCKYEIKKSPSSPEIESRQVIGWDPRTAQPVSWHFDANGGFGHGDWVRKDKQWLVQAEGVERNGSSSAATNVISINDANSFLWQSVNRSIDGVAFADTAPLKIQRVVK